MAGMTDLAIRIATTLDSTGLNKAGKGVDKLNSRVKSLGKTLGLTLGTAAMVAYGKASVKAFTDAEKSNTQLANSVKNLGLELSQSNITSYLDKISAASGIAGEKLNEAFQSILTTSGSVLKSQELLNLALDVSAGSGQDLVGVSNDLAQAYIGKTRSLAKYNLGLSQSQLKTASFESLVEKLNKQFSGANAAYLDTYAGKLQRLGEAGGAAQEKIGGAIVDLAMSLSNSSDIDDLITKIDTLADKIVGMFDAFSEGVAIIRGILQAKTWGGMRDAVQKAQVEEYNRRMRRDYMKAWEGTDIPKSAKQLVAEKAAEAAAKKRAQELLKATKGNTAELKKQAALKKAGSIFDLEQVQLIAALKGKLSEEDRKRVELQFALLTGNVSEAKKLTYELAIAQGLTVGIAKDLASLPDAKNPFASWEAYLDMLMGKARQLASMGSTSVVVAPSMSTASTNTVPSYTGTPFGQAGSFVDTIGTPFGQAGGNGSGYIGTPFGQAPIVVQIDGKAIATALQDSSMSGITSSINRTYGGFGL